jgi:putative DNA primase/helicase
VAGRECFEAALDYLARGWCAIPCCPPDHVGVGKGHARCKSPGKAPLVRWTEFQSRRPTAGEINDWWRRWPNANVYVVLGPVSGLVRLDVDAGQGEEFLAEVSGGDLPDTLEMVTGGGRGLFYAIPPGFTPRPTHRHGDRLHEGLSLLGRGSGTVMPPSRHRSGRRYAWVPGRGPGEIAPAPMPGWLIEAMRPDARERGRRPAQSGTGRPGEQIPEGSRNATLTSLAGTMRRRGMSREAIEAALLAENAARCDPPLHEDEVRRIAASVCRYDPDPAVTIRGAPSEPSANGPGHPPDPLPDGPAGRHDRAEELLLTDLGNAGRFRLDHGCDTRYCHPWGKWLVWDGTRWAEDRTAAVGRMARSTVRGLLREAHRQIEHLSAMIEEASDGEEGGDGE